MERLKDAIEKARARREMMGAPRGQSPRPAAPAPAAASGSAGGAWAALDGVDLDDEWLAAQRLVSWKKSDPSYVVFDVLRTRLSPLLRDKGWRRIALTSPTKGCGKTTVAINTAMSFARQPGVRAMLLDLDLKAPKVAHALGLRGIPFGLADWLVSDEPPQSHFVRLSDNLVVGLNTRRASNSAELIQDPRIAPRLASTIQTLVPDVVIYDLPPMLVSDDALAFLPQVDGVLLVAGAGQTTADEIEECERLLDGQANFLGVVLNRCEAATATAYRYYGYHDIGQAEHA